MITKENVEKAIIGLQQRIVENIEYFSGFTFQEKIGHDGGISMTERQIPWDKIICEALRNLHRQDPHNMENILKTFFHTQKPKTIKWMLQACEFSGFLEENSLRILLLALLDGNREKYNSLFPPEIEHLKEIDKYLAKKARDTREYMKDPKPKENTNVL